VADAQSERIAFNLPRPAPQPCDHLLHGLAGKTPNEYFCRLGTKCYRVVFIQTEYLFRQFECELGINLLSPELVGCLVPMSPF